MTTSMPGIPGDVRPPVMPLSERLPLDSPGFSWTRFEGFCVDLVSELDGVVSAKHYGRQGSKQRGIDIIAELADGGTWVFQCRQIKSFEPAEAAKAIKECTYPAGRFTILVSCIVGSRVRDVCTKHPGSEVWDADDISRQVRKLPPDVAVRLVERHFGSVWSQAFLGASSPLLLVPAKEFFRPWLDSRRLFNHTWALVGRRDVVTWLKEFVHSTGSRVAILVGRGTIGKTKILQAFSDELEREAAGLPVRFVAEGIPVTGDGLKSLPSGACLIVVDDAHTRDDLDRLLAAIGQRAVKPKLVLSCRPYALSMLRPLLVRHSFDLHTELVEREIKELSRDEVRELARAALGPKLEHLADSLAALTRDSPLVTVLGGRLLAEKGLDPRLLYSEREFREVVLSRFSDLSLDWVEDSGIERTVCHQVLRLIAAVQPLRLTDTIQEVAAEFVGIDEPSLNICLGKLEEAGMLIRRGGTLRITPDILAHHELHRACVNAQGDPTGFATEVFKRFEHVCPAEVLRNLAELDWQICHEKGENAPGLLSEVWRLIEDEFRNKSDRHRILGLVERVAYYQPARSLALVEYAMNCHMEAFEVNKLPGILEAVSYSLEHLPRCCDLLWQLCRDDQRPQGDAMRALRQLASYDLRKPVTVQEMVLDAVTRWLGAPDAHDHLHSPLDVLEPVLATSGLSATDSGGHLELRGFIMDVEATRAVRERALALLRKAATSDRIKVALRAVDILGSALQGPLGPLGRPVPDEVRNQWVPDQLKVLQVLREVALQGRHPVCTLRAIEKLVWPACHAEVSQIRDAALAAIADVPDTFDLRLYRALLDSFGLDSVRAAVDEGAFREQGKEWDARARIAQELIERHPSGSRATRALNQAIKDIEAAGLDPKPGYFLGAFDAGYSAAICEATVSTPSSPLAPYLSSLLHQIRRSNPRRAIILSRRAVATRQVGLCLSVGRYLPELCGGDPTRADLKALDRLLSHPHEQVRCLATLSLRYLAHPSEVAARLRAVKVGDSPAVADALCAALDAGKGLPDAVLKDLLGKLASVASLGYHVNKLLAYASRRIPSAAMKWLLDRASRCAASQGEGFEALPLLGFNPPLDGLAQSSDYPSFLRRIRNRILQAKPDDRVCLRWLFKEVSLNYGTASLKALSEWVVTGQAAKICQAAQLLLEAPDTFVLDNVGFVASMLRYADAAGPDCYEYVSSILHTCATGGVRSGRNGEPFQEDVTLRDRASDIIQTLPPGSLEYQFYQSLEAAARSSIQEQVARGEELLDR